MKGRTPTVELLNAVGMGPGNCHFETLSLMVSLSFCDKSQVQALKKEKARNVQYGEIFDHPEMPSRNH